jgi:hypothetical protein
MSQRKPAPDLVRGGYRFADKNMRHSITPRARFRLRISVVRSGSVEARRYRELTRGDDCTSLVLSSANGKMVNGSKGEWFPRPRIGLQYMPPL